MQTIPLSDNPSQSVQVQLNGQNCTMNIYQKSTGLFIDVYVNNALIIGGVICQNINPIVRDVYLGFSGDLMFNDTTGNDDPSYPGIGSRYELIYLLPSEL